jgi:hypothetical protein
MHPVSRTHSARGAQPGFYLQPSGIRVGTVFALQMLDVQYIVANDIGLREDVMAGNAGRGIDQAALVAPPKDPAIEVRIGGRQPSDNAAQ